MLDLLQSPPPPQGERHGPDFTGNQIEFQRGTTAHPQAVVLPTWGFSWMHCGNHRRSPPGSEMLDVPFWKPLPVGGVPGTHTCLLGGSGQISGAQQETRQAASMPFTL